MPWPTSWPSRAIDMPGAGGRHILFLCSNKLHHQGTAMADVPIKPLTDQFAFAPQLTPEDMAGVAAHGYKSVIINLPHFEGGTDQPTTPAVPPAAHDAGPRAGVLPHRHPMH